MIWLIVAALVGYRLGGGQGFIPWYIALPSMLVVSILGLWHSYKSLKDVGLM